MGQPVSETFEEDINQYLTFILDDEYYAVSVSFVKEVLELGEVTKVPKTPDFFYGVLNLRGSVVPIIDLRLKFGLAPIVPTIDTCIVVLEVVVAGENTVIGALTDSVHEVIELDSDDLHPAPRVSARINYDFISSMAKFDEKFLMLLDINKIFTQQELGVIRDAEQENSIAE
ncbi:chemotaxis protein CheW [Teredinibacter sp. KSP-S5-2]|uniref:chemotaxis protein CheW n=1 Tax=Teredinibacter sp. KSP-S5-2 TaxID=3034506 RepID=UPI0029345962|nr:chemotaxis protein CheW [Teredinibacter sp. KSP-S5-2]WNO08159.1 chemotaxis protein CheW [Teredinibacter sp. KSP-S5-2]